MTVTTRRSVDELRAIAEEGAALGEVDAETLMAWVATKFAPEAMTVACSMADAVLPHVVARYVPDVEVLFLETGYHFPETLAMRDTVAKALPITVVDVTPKQTVAEQDAEFGEKLHDRNPTLCCQMRKVDPLNGALEGYEVWFTGVRRDEAPTRTNTPLVTFDEKHGMVKVNPLAAWSFDDLNLYSEINELPVNPLLAQGYPSIGCFPCTRKVAPGEDIRSGRWSGTDKVECGIHV
ncbi:phosphoadenylyl-sulfate reductase [Kribbia dieselivorans]|uniref:phosphoadenylyl-sulfate reductase n=1 Tax=Kribbia dieselivorans TaxID=331526 RepID=UPI0008399ED9|nr:phosphoadenylyl-sulfate reductase [Kribbia dieselivorans]